MGIRYKIQDTFARKGYEFYDGSTPYNLNIVAIRNSGGSGDKFDDYLAVIYRNHKWEWEEMIMPCTTHSGTHYLRNPLNKKGTAIILAGQYKGAYKIGIHGRTWASGGYKALEQKGNITYCRDSNKDQFVDTYFPTFEANLKTNIHRAFRSKIAKFIKTYSAGCIVVPNPDDYEKLIDVCEKSLEYFSNSFTLTLINNDDTW